jgi:hypothetical protein
VANRNEAVVEILKLAYEFERSVARPGTADWFLRAIYEPTKLDLELLPDILDDRFDLVLLTGNPGDGKSAFLNQLLNEERTTRSGRRIRVRHDATEPSDPEDRAASALADLVGFLRPLSDEGWDPAVLGSTAYVVGINKGLLVRAFLAHSSPFSRLSDSVAAALRGSGRVEEPMQLGVVDLNRRAAVTLPLESRESILDRLLERIVGPSLWEERGCADCEDAGWCPFFNNAKRLRNGLPRQRLKLLWLVQQLRSERHATIRDVLAGLAYILIGHEDMFRMGDDPSSEIQHPCAFVERERATGDTLALFRRVVYNSAFVDSDLYEGRTGAIVDHAPRSAERTYGMAPAVVSDYLTALDPARGLSNDHWDAVEERFLTRPAREIEKIVEHANRDEFELERAVFQRFSDALHETAQELEQVEPSDRRYPELIDRYQWLSYLLVRTAKRRSFFFGEARVSELSPFASLEIFLDTVGYLSGGSPATIEAYETVLWEMLPAGLIRSEGIVLADERPTRLEVRWSQGRGEVGAVLVLPLRDPELKAEPEPVPYVETFPQRLVFRPGSDVGGLQALTMSLDTFEGLARLAAGYHEGFAGVPRTSQLRNFREALRALLPEEMVILDFDDPSSRVNVTVRERMRFD